MAARKRCLEAAAHCKARAACAGLRIELVLPRTDQHARVKYPATKAVGFTGSRNGGLVVVVRDVQEPVAFAEKLDSLQATPF